MLPLSHISVDVLDSRTEINVEDKDQNAPQESRDIDVLRKEKGCIGIREMHIEK